MKRKNKRKKTEEFIQEAQTIHKKKYDYSKCIYINAHTKVCIICPIHGEFLQTPHSHLKGCGCIECGKIKAIQSRKSCTEEFIRKAKLIHGNKYDYSNTEYKGVFTKVKIICPDHGEFWQTPNIHLKGSGCEKCCGRFVKNTETFIMMASKIHLNKYDYSKVQYRDGNSKVCITCPTHGKFWQTPGHHLSGEGCPSCSISTPKAESEIISMLSPLKIIQYDRTILCGKEIDIYIPSLKIGVEFNGLYWHSENYGKFKTYHADKIQMCNTKNIMLINVFEDEWVNNKKLCEYRLKQICNIHNTNKVDFSKCDFNKVKDKKNIETFVRKNTFINKTSFSSSLGMYFNDELIALLLFKENNDNIIKIKCLAVSLEYDFNEVGGELLRFFIKNYTFKQLIFIGDKKWVSNISNNIYINNGFKIHSYIHPQKWYYNRTLIPYKRYTQREYIKNNPSDKNWISVWDCGSIKYLYDSEQNEKR